MLQPMRKWDKVLLRLFGNQAAPEPFLAIFNDDHRQYTVVATGSG